MFGLQMPLKNVLTLLVAFTLFVAAKSPAVTADDGFRNDPLRVGYLDTPLEEPALQEAPNQETPGDQPATETSIEPTETPIEPTEPGFQQPGIYDPPIVEEPTPSQNNGSAGSAMLSDQPSSGIKLQPLESHPFDNQPLDAMPEERAPATPGVPFVPAPEKATARFVRPEVASFAGITPGESTTDEVEKAWGAPAEVVRQEGLMVHRYKIDPFERIEVVFTGNKVATIIVRLDGSLPANKLMQELKIDDVSPVFVSGELGEILGQAFPERGVLFAFDQNQKTNDGPANPVSEIVLEPLGADPFVLRAESRLDSHFEENLRDLELAIQLNPSHARAYWLYSRVLCAVGRTDESVQAIRHAIRLDEKNPQYRITFAQILDQLNNYDEAVAQAKAAVENSQKQPHIKARAYCLLGDLMNASAKPDMAKALEYHTAAIKTAESLLSNRHPALRKMAKEVVIDAHLGAASDIAWGEWKNKGKAVDRWTALAAAFAEELIANDGGTDEHRFRVASRALAAYVGAGRELDPTEWAEESLQVGQKMIQQAVDPTVRQQLEWETGMAAFNAVQVYQARDDKESSLKYGQIAAEHLEAGLIANEPEQTNLLGRLHFRLGAIYALAKNNHESAIPFYERAAQFFELQVPNQPPLELGRQGEAYVSMGVSFWKVGRKDEAFALTKRGVELVKKAVDAGAMPNTALIVPYENLANMQRYDGQVNAAAMTQQLANAIKESQAQNPNVPQTATKPGGKVMR